MQEQVGLSLEAALARTEADAEAALKAATAVSGALKRLRGAAHAGNLREMGPAIEAAEKALAGLARQIEAAKGGWDFDEEAYFGDGHFTRELIETAGRMDLRIHEQDERLYSYPTLLRVLPSDRAVLIDRARERRVRPSVLVNLLKELQQRPPRFRPEAFLESLFRAYRVLVAPRGRDALKDVAVVPLLEIYDLMTLRPGESREYSRQEFGRDIYLLDQSGVTETRRGYTASFPASTGTRAPSGTLRVITRGGEEKVYYGIAFTPGG